MARRHGLSRPPSWLTCGSFCAVCVRWRAGRVFFGGSGYPHAKGFSKVRGSVLDVAVCESAKPGRGNDNDAELWTVRSTASFAERHLIGESLRDETAAKEELLGAFSAVVGVESASSPHVFEVFAWDHSQPVDMISGASCSLDADRRLGVCGDFYGVGGVGGDDDDDVHGVEASARSGDALARALADAFL